MLTMVTAAVALFYLSAIPIHVAFRLQLGGGSRFTLGISIFEPRFALRRAAGTRADFVPPKPPENLRITDALSAAKAALKHLKLESARIDGRLGTDDAALTAMICGSVSSIGCALRCAAGRKIRIGLTPDFSADRLRAELSGMICVRAGHIMIAALMGALQYGSRRLKEWTSIPLKVS